MRESNRHPTLSAAAAHSLIATARVYRGDPGSVAGGPPSDGIRWCRPHTGTVRADDRPEGPQVVPPETPDRPTIVPPHEPPTKEPQRPEVLPLTEPPTKTPQQPETEPGTTDGA